MSSFNEKLKQISLKEIICLLIILLILNLILNMLNVVHIGLVGVNVLMTLYILYRIGDLSGLKSDIADAFSKETLKLVLVVVFLNIFFSYGMLYLSNLILLHFPDLGFLVHGSIPPIYLGYSIAGGFLATVVISPIFEELFFRGILLNKLNSIVPVTFSILITSLLFASMHTFGSIISAFIFAICMAILYIKTDNIVVAILAHFLNNLFAESIVNLDVNNILFTNEGVMILVSVLAVVSAILLMFSIVKELNNIKY